MLFRSEVCSPHISVYLRRVASTRPAAELCVCVCGSPLCPHTHTHSCQRDVEELKWLFLKAGFLWDYLLWEREDRLMCWKSTSRDHGGRERGRAEQEREEREKERTKEKEMERKREREGEWSVVEFPDTSPVLSVFSSSVCFLQFCFLKVCLFSQQSTGAPLSRITCNGYDRLFL